MLNYFKKFAMEIVPSVAATIIGAYIVNHYIDAKPAAEAPAAAVVDRPAQIRRQADAASSQAPPRRRRRRSDAEVAGIPAAGVKAKGMSEKGMLEKNAAAEKAVVVEKPAEKPGPDRRQAGRDHGQPAAPNRSVRPPPRAAQGVARRRCSP